MWCWLGIGKDFKRVGLPTAVEKDDAHDFFWEPFFKLVKFLALLFLMTFFSETHMVHHILILDRLSVSQVWCPRATLELALFCFWWVGMLIWFWGFFLHMSILCIFNWHPRYKWRSNRNFFEISRLANSLWCPLMISWQVSIIILKFFIRLWLGSLATSTILGSKWRPLWKLGNARSWSMAFQHVFSCL